MCSPTKNTGRIEYVEVREDAKDVSAEQEWPEVTNRESKPEAKLAEARIHSLAQELISFSQTRSLNGQLVDWFKEHKVKSKKVADKKMEVIWTDSLIMDTKVWGVISNYVNCTEFLSNFFPQYSIARE